MSIYITKTKSTVRITQKRICILQSYMFIQTMDRMVQPTLSVKGPGGMPDAGKKFEQYGHPAKFNG